MTQAMQFFATGTPEAPGAPLRHYKDTLAGAQAGAPMPAWRVDPANLGLLSRAVGELAQRGARGLEIRLPAEDLDFHQTVVAHEAALVPVLRRLRDKSPAGFALPLMLSTGRTYVLPPPSLDLSTNDLCGLACVMCSNRNERRDPHTIAATAVADLIRDAADWGIRRIALTGAGEPFADPALVDHMTLADQLGCLVTVTTSGMPVTERLADRLAPLHASLSVSIHGASDALADRITGIPGSGARAWEAVRRLVAARDRAHRRGAFHVSVSSVIQRDNLHEIEALIQRSRDAGCDGHNLQPINLQHGSFRNGTTIRREDAALMSRLWPTPEQAPLLDRLFDTLAATRRRDPYVRTDPDRLELFRRYFADSSRDALRVRCRVGEHFLAVDHRGRIKPCYRLPWHLGDARLRSLRRLWNSAAYTEVRQTVEACPLTCMNNCFFRS